MPLLYAVFALIIAGIGLWIINTFIPMAGSIKAILNLVVVISVGVWLLKSYGLWNQLLEYRFPH